MLSCLSSLHEANEPENPAVDWIEDDLSIEYIIPTNLDFKKNEDWRRYLNADQEEYEERYDQKLGNITITDRPISTGSGENPFIEKRD